MSYCIFITCTAILFFVAFLTVFIYSGLSNRILTRLGLQERKIKKNWSLIGWENCLNKLNYHADIAFFGDSLTRGSDFGKYFSQKTVNLGLAGDTLEGMRQRITMIKAVAPKKVFILGGINNLNDSNCNYCVREYEKLLISLISDLPDTIIYVQSLLPISSEKENRAKKKCHNDTIDLFNKQIKALAKKYNVIYIDLFSKFIVNGEINPELTVDGLHLNEKAYEIWASIIAPYVKT